MFGVRQAANVFNVIAFLIGFGATLILAQEAGACALWVSKQLKPQAGNGAASKNLVLISACQTPPADQAETDDQRKNRESLCLLERLHDLEELRKQGQLPEPSAPDSDEAASEQFLIAGGYTPKVAKILSKYEWGQVFRAMIDEAGIKLEEFQTFLNSLTSEDDLKNLRVLVERAVQVHPNKAGKFPRMANNDASVKAASSPLSDRSATPRSLNGILILGHRLFEGRFPGPVELSDPRNRG